MGWLVLGVLEEYLCLREYLEFVQNSFSHFLSGFRKDFVIKLMKIQYLMHLGEVNRKPT